MLFPKHCCGLRFKYWPNVETFFFWYTLLGYFRGKVRSENSFGVYPYIRKIFLSINSSCLFNFDQLKGHFGLFGTVSGYFGVGVGSENYFEVYSYILSTFVYWVTQNSLHFQYWPIQGHLGLFGAIFGSFRVWERSEIYISLLIYKKNHFLSIALSCVCIFDQF